MASDFPVTATVTRTELSLSNLILSEANGYYIVRKGIGPGDTSWRRVTVDSPFVHGRALVHAVKDVTTVPLKVRVEGFSQGSLHTKIQTLTNAFDQFSYTLTVVFDGVQYVWDCEPADYTIGDGGSWDDLYARSYYQVVSLNIPRKP